MGATASEVSNVREGATRSVANGLRGTMQKGFQVEPVPEEERRVSVLTMVYY